MSIKEIKSGTLYKEYALEIPYEEINKIIGCHSNEIQNILGYISKSEVVHKDDMVRI